MVLVQKEIKRVYIGDSLDNTKYIQIRPNNPKWLCFTANTAGSYLSLNKSGYPTAVNIEISYDGKTWTDYTAGTTINLSTVGSKVFMRNKSETQTSFGTSSSNYYNFVMGGSIAASGDVNYLLCKESTLTLTPSANYVFYNLFANCSSLTTAPELPATTLKDQCYIQMFNNCANLVVGPSLPAETATTRCYYMMFQSCPLLTTVPKVRFYSLASQSCQYMFNGCSSVKVSNVQDSNYTQEFVRLSGIATSMFSGTGGAYTGNAESNVQYYLHKDNIMV